MKLRLLAGAGFVTIVSVIVIVIVIVSADARLERKLAQVSVARLRVRELERGRVAALAEQMQHVRGRHPIHNVECRLVNLANRAKLIARHAERDDGKVLGLLGRRGAGVKHAILDELLDRADGTARAAAEAEQATVHPHHGNAHALLKRVLGHAVQCRLRPLRRVVVAERGAQRLEVDLRVAGAAPRAAPLAYRPPTSCNRSTLPPTGLQSAYRPEARCLANRSSTCRSAAQPQQVAGIVVLARGVLREPAGVDGAERARHHGVVSANFLFVMFVLAVQCFVLPRSEETARRGAPTSSWYTKRGK